MIESKIMMIMNIMLINANLKVESVLEVNEETFSYIYINVSLCMYMSRLIRQFLSLSDWLRSGLDGFG